MSQREPTKPYVYQPDPPCPGEGPVSKQRIFAIGGGPDSLYGVRFTKAEAIGELNRLRNPGGIQHNHSAGSFSCPHPDCEEE